eukprot:TRINITY_DN10758_c0_g1_i1.p1 TRINITY_DN10758_c0_g1~~TRINITY_DN10758_c0_g1_i1.p1  ORF type:complete len:316 (-),score=58.69 TRINITY_DN10758_c0_g1_i1:288-1235(-)
MKGLNWLCCFAEREGTQPESSDACKLSIIGGNSDIFGKDAERVEAAFARKDTHALVQSLDSWQAIECSDQMHPWAENPRSVGALAAARLAMLAQDNEVVDTQREIAHASGAIPKLVLHLQSDKEDRVHHAIMALSMLVGSHENAIEAFNANALVFLLALVDDVPRSKLDVEPPPRTLNVRSEMRALVSTTILNMCMEDDKVRQKFMELDGFAILARQLSSVPEDAPHRANVLLEIVVDILDLIEADIASNSAVSTLNDECAAAFSQAGGEKELLALLSFADGDLHSTIQELLYVLNARAVGNTGVPTLPAAKISQ